jgi:hypothetical protein
VLTPSSAGLPEFAAGGSLGPPCEATMLCRREEYLQAGLKKAFKDAYVEEEDEDAAALSQLQAADEVPEHLQVCWCMFALHSQASWCMTQPWLSP